MTDIESMRAMLERAGVKYTEKASDYMQLPAGSTSLFVDEDDTGFGYSGFLVEMVFAPDGRLLKVGAWE